MHSTNTNTDACTMITPSSSIIEQQQRQPSIERRILSNRSMCIKNLNRIVSTRAMVVVVVGGQVAFAIISSCNRTFIAYIVQLQRVDLCACNVPSDK